MDFAEFRRIMGNRFTPSSKGKTSVKIKAMSYSLVPVCSLPGSPHKYADGAEHVAECNAW